MFLIANKNVTWFLIDSKNTRCVTVCDMVMTLIETVVVFASFLQHHKLGSLAGGASRSHTVL